MNITQTAIKNIIFYRKKYFAVICAIALSTAIICSSLTIGDTVKFNLKNLVNQRLQNTEFVITANNRFFSKSLAEKLEVNTDNKAIPVFMFKGIVINPEASQTVFNTQIIGIDSSFSEIALYNKPDFKLYEDDIIINRKLASRLNVKEGEELVVKMEKISLIPADAPFVPDESKIVTARLKIKKIAEDNDLGNFSLQNNQSIPYNIFISHETLIKYLELKNVINVILVQGNKTTTEDYLLKKIQETWTVSDFNLKTRKIEGVNEFEIYSDRIFIENPVRDYFLQNSKSAGAVLTYLVNSIQNKQLSTPYSFVSGIGKNVSFQNRDSEIILNKWIADDISAKTGDTVDLTYYVINPLRKLETRTIKLKVAGIVEMKDWANDKFLMPEFDGLTDVDHCSDWETGIEVDLKKIRKKDEDYWTNYKGTPKAFISYNLAEKIWGTSFGNCTAIRFSDSTECYTHLQNITKKITPAALGFTVTNVKQKALNAAGAGVDFAQLFLSLSFFMLLAAVILIYILHAMALNDRINETGTLKSLGFSNKYIFKLFITEGFLITIPAIVLGVFLGIGMLQMLVFSINTIWNDIVSTHAMVLNITAGSVIIALLSGLAISVLSVFYCTKKTLKQQINRLQRKFIFKPGNNILWILLLAFSVIGILAGLGYSIFKQNLQNPVMFLISGILLLTGLISVINIVFNKISLYKDFTPERKTLIIKSLIFERKRNLSQIFLLATGTFIVIATGLNRIDFYENTNLKSSGTGGYTIIGEAAIPILSDLNTKKAQSDFALPELPDTVRFVALRTLSGDDASCLNLNRITNPQIMGVPAEKFASEERFSFAATNYNTTADTWRMLNDTTRHHIYNAIADQTVIQWGMGKKLGDTLSYLNQYGDTISFVLIAGLNNSVFQGNLLISDEVFLKNYPNYGGTRYFLTENTSPELFAPMAEAFNSFGCELEKTNDRLARFNVITNTYLEIFMVFGCLGILIATIAIAILLYKSALQNKSQYAVMLALGINKTFIYKYVLWGNTIPLTTGILTGTISGLLAVLPMLLEKQFTEIMLLLILIIIPIFVNGFLWNLYFTRKIFTISVRELRVES